MYDSINLSQLKRDKLISKLEQLKVNSDDDTFSILNEIETELKRTTYGLVWEEHSEEVDDQMKSKIPVFINVKDKEIKTVDDNNYNFLLQGDNLLSLQLLEKTHKGKVDLIYIDPPYNTGKKDFVYNDEMIDDENNFRHSKWLSFMNRRLKIAKNLLKNDGIIFISIDDNEYAPLKLLCDEIFGENNLLSVHHIQVRYGNKNLNERKDFQECLEYVLIYARDSSLFSANKPSEDYSVDNFCYEITELSKGIKTIIGGKNVTIFKNGEYSLVKHSEGNLNLLKATWASGSIVKGNASGKFFESYLKPRKDIDGLSTLYKVDGIGEDGLGYRYFIGPKKTNASQGLFYSGVPLDRLEEMKLGISKKYRPIPNFYDFSPDFGNIRSEGGVPFNSGKKPIKMIKQFINYHKSKDILVLDFFAGSGSTGHAVLDLNNEDGGQRKFILCTNNENNICENITYERIKNVINGYQNHIGIPSNLMYYRTDFVNKKKDGSVPNALLKHVKELIQLQYNCKIDNKEIIIAFNEEELDKFFENDLSKCKKIFIPRDVFLNTKQKSIISKFNIDKIYIPEYYFAKELKEIDEL